jgi:hypothetical protein
MEERREGVGGECSIMANQPETKARRPLEGTGMVATFWSSAATSRAVAEVQAISKQPGAEQQGSLLCGTRAKSRGDSDDWGSLLQALLAVNVVGWLKFNKGPRSKHAKHSVVKQTNIWQ